jgi:hypothetical protein
MWSSLVVAAYDRVRLTPRFLAALHLDLFEQPAFCGAGEDIACTNGRRWLRVEQSG